MLIDTYSFIECKKKKTICDLPVIMLYYSNKNTNNNKADHAHSFLLQFNWLIHFFNVILFLY